MNDSRDSISSLLRAIAPLALLSMSAASCTIHPDDAPEPVGEAQGGLVGGFTTLNFGSTDDEGGAVVPSGRSCFLAGVWGNLSIGEDWGYAGSRESEAGLRAGRLRAHGGAYDPPGSDLPDWQDNYVGARAVCVSDWDASHVAGDTQSVGVGSSGTLTAYYKRIADLDPNGKRQCWLTHLNGVDLTWQNSASYAKVKAYTSTDANHPTTGWWLDIKLTQSAKGAADVTADCWDFPGADDWGTHSVTSSAGSFGTTTWTALSATACGLTEITGNFNDNWAENGAYIIPPATGTTWTLKAFGGKTAKAVCVH